MALTAALFAIAVHVPPSRAAPAVSIRAATIAPADLTPTLTMTRSLQIEFTLREAQALLERADRLVAQVSRSTAPTVAFCNRARPSRDVCYVPARASPLRA